MWKIISGMCPPSTLSAGSYPVYEVRDDLFTDISVDETLNFFLKLENCVWSVHVDLGLHITPYKEVTWSKVTRSGRPFQVARKLDHRLREFFME